MVLSIVIQMPIGLALATFLDKVGRKGNVCKVIWFIPMLMSSVAIGYLFRYALDANTGFVTAISKFFGGGTVDLLGNTGTVLITCIFIIAWQFIPFYMVYYLAGYSGLPSDVHEAAMVDGATESQYFWQISLPLLKPTIKSAVVLSIVGSLKYFDLVYVLTNGGPCVRVDGDLYVFQRVQLLPHGLRVGDCIRHVPADLCHSDCYHAGPEWKGGLENDW